MTIALTFENFYTEAKNNPEVKQDEWSKDLRDFFSTSELSRLQQAIAKEKATALKIAKDKEKAECAVAASLVDILKRQLTTRFTK